MLLPLFVHKQSPAAPNRCSSGIIFAILLLLSAFGKLEMNAAPVAVPTYHYDNTRWGINTNETLLTLANVNTNTFSRLFTNTVDGYVYAQPLIMTNVLIPGSGIHTVVYVATEHDSVYAFDADNNAGSNAVPLWKTSFINAAAGVTTVPKADVNSSDITPEIGITGTPVIDPATGTIYVEAKTKEVTGGVTTYVHRLHALDITTGLERTNFNSPAVITASGWNALRQHARSALTLANGVVYIAFASHGDNTPYHGWLFAYNAAHVNQQLGFFNSTPNGSDGGFWGGGGGPSIDAAGNLFMITGNGTFDATGGSFTSNNNFAMSVLKFSTNNGVTLVDYFSPFNQSTLSSFDQDLGAGSALILPDSAGSVAHPHLVVGAGKSGEGHVTPGGKIYLIDRDNMGRFNAASDGQIVQVITNAIGGSYSTPAFWNSTLYFGAAKGDTLKAFAVSGGLINTNPIKASTTFTGFGATPVITANGSQNGIVWLIQTDTASATLHAYNATNVAQELYNSSQFASRDNPGLPVKFTAPAVANGKVYIGTQSSLAVFGVSNSVVPVTNAPGFAVNFSVGPGGANPYFGQGAYSDTGNSFWNLVPASSGLASSPALTSGSNQTAITITLNFGFNNSGLPNASCPNGTPGYLLGTEDAVNAGSPGIGSAGNPTGQFVLSHISPGIYSLYLYAANFDGNRGSIFALNAANGGIADGGFTGTSNSQPATAPATFALGDNYVLFHNVVPDATGAITGMYIPNPAAQLQGEAPFNGLQLAQHLITISNGPPGNVTVRWSGGALQSASGLQGPWNTIPAASPLSLPATSGAQYFRVY